jgi:hypothetical protein
MSFFAGTEVFTVNELGMPFDSNDSSYSFSAFYFGLKYTTTTKDL